MALTTNKSEREFTIERKISTSIYQFRCDLALVTRYISNLIYAEYDHLVRSGNSRFTDHSAIILEMPVTFYPVNIHTPELFPEYNSESRNPVVVSSHKTAMGRVIPSSVAKKIVQSKLFNPSKIKILDYGCGRGMDLIYYKSMGYEADGWDPYEPFGYSIRPKTKYDLVICTFVLNVLYNRYERLKVIKEACSYLQPNGVLIIATRSPETIEHEALTKHWKPYNDGYWSSVSRRTFQRGISLKEIKIICEHLGYFIHPFTKILNCVSDTVVAVVSPFES
jgi:SAM-dependent methyltransferase